MDESYVHGELQVEQLFESNSTFAFNGKWRII
jgi:hypothetical protein